MNARLPIPTQRSIDLCADRLRFFSAYADLEALIDRIDNGPGTAPEDDLNRIIRDGLIDLKLGLAGAIDNLAKQAATRELMDADEIDDPALTILNPIPGKDAEEAREALAEMLLAGEGA